MHQGDPYALPVVHVRTLPPLSAQESTDPNHYTLDQGPMKVLYGFDGPSAQFFLNVADTRLCWLPDAPREVNQMCRAVCSDGGGCYLSLHTGPNGPGRRVTTETLAEFWVRYGVPYDHVAALHKGHVKF